MYRKKLIQKIQQLIDKQHERRMNVIGQNGNDGLAYETTMTYEQEFINKSDVVGAEKVCKDECNSSDCYWDDVCCNDCDDCNSKPLDNATQRKDTTQGLIEELVFEGILTKKGSSFIYQDTNIAQGMKNLRLVLDNSPELLEHLKADLVDSKEVKPLDKAAQRKEAKKDLLELKLSDSDKHFILLNDKYKNI